MKKGLIVAVILIIAGFGGWYFASPSIAMSGLRDAAVEGDREELKDRVDFPAVRESLKAQVRAHFVTEMQKEKDNPFAALGMAMAGAIVDPMIDGIVSPSGIKAMVQQGRMQTDARDANAAVQTEKKPVEWSIDRRGFDKFLAKPKTEAGQNEPTLVFERDGLGWRLVDIEIPEGGLGKDRT
ncbi:DUF2939 domain-containing protein [Sphingobium sp.]|uniref:DUF2939 domain-containing protein n=1 Tax=Sphingobium sp. TaxID=1912891 RepID=UPI00257E06F2|nr:DUF2939 domain-containing protein [Sphingobium sp.]MBR2270403.1 DUF2939 domain-containing protein [Sphingobium sp.]